MKMMEVVNMKKGIHHGWLIVLGSFFMMATCYAVFVNCLNLFLVPITNDLGITRGQFNANTSIAAIVGVFASLFVGKLVQKCNARIFGIVNILLIVSSLACWSLVTQLWQMYLLSVVTGFTVISGTRLMISLLIANWFDHKRGLAVSLSLSGSGVGGMILSQVAASSINTYGWRTTFLILALITLIISMPLTVTVFHNNPFNIGLLPYGVSNESNNIAVGGKNQGYFGVTAKRAIRSGAFWLLLLGFLLMGLINGGVIINISANFTDAGYSAEFAANIVSLQLFVLIVGKITVGMVFDRYGVIRGIILGGITLMLATIGMFFAHNTFGPYLFALTFGFGTSLGTIAPPLIVIHEFGKKEFGSLVGYVTAIQMFGGAVGSILTGILYDRMGSYQLGWIILTFTSIVMLIAMLGSVLLAKKMKKEFDEESEDNSVSLMEA